MPEELEIERKFLVKFIPSDLKTHKSKKLIDIYIPRKQGHAAIRIRQQGDKFFITKKSETENSNELREETLEITEEDFNIFRSMGQAKIIEKTRYYYPISHGIAEIDVFEGSHNGLVLAEIEFSSHENLRNSEMPEFCLADVSKEDFTAGGVLCNLTYSDIESNLNSYGYVKINL